VWGSKKAGPGVVSRIGENLWALNGLFFDYDRAPTNQSLRRLGSHPTFWSVGHDWQDQIWILHPVLMEYSHEALGENTSAGAGSLELLG